MSLTTRLSERGEEGTIDYTDGVYKCRGRTGGV